jgi:hypothetical protein
MDRSIFARCVHDVRVPIRARRSADRLSPPLCLAPELAPQLGLPDLVKTRRDGLLSGVAAMQIDQIRSWAGKI